MADELDVVAVAVGAGYAQTWTARSAVNTRLDALRRSDADLHQTFGQRLACLAVRHQLVTCQTAVAERRVARHEVDFGWTLVVHVEVVRV